MRLLFVQKYADTGGSKQSLLGSLAALAADGAEPAVITEGGGEFSEGCRDLGIEVFEGWIPDFRKVKYRFALPFLLDPLYRQIRGKGFDWVISNEIFWAPHCRHLARRIGGRSAAIVRDSNASGSRIGKYRLRRLDRVLCVSDALREIVALPNARRVYNAIALGSEAEVSDRELGLPEDGPSRWLVVVGKLSPRKNQIAAVEVLALLLEDGFDDLGLVLAGSSVEDYEERIRDRVRELALEERVVFTGHCPRVRQLVERADALLLTSEREGLPRSLLEGLLLNRPSFSTPLPGLDEIYGEDQAHFVSATADPRALASLVATVLRDPEASMPRVERLRDRVARQWSPKAHLEQLRAALT